MANIERGSKRAKNIDLAEIKVKGASNVAKVEEKKVEAAKAKVEQAEKAKVEAKNEQRDEERTYQAKDLAERLGITPFRARQFLRSLDRYQDGKYTRYRFTALEIDQLVELYHTLKANKKAKQEAAGA